ncbi:MAG: RimK/LysX family protein [Cyclobacteriaceae bacterium]|nr:RimK/LysX family protein [Cyclobacteriaceae bacterium]
MLILGRSDRVDLPGLGLSNIQAKIDTGAYTSALHCSNVQLVNGKLEFILLDEEHPEFTGMKFTFDEYDQREIKNSFGQAELRFIIKTTVRIHGRTFKTQFSLSDRDNLKFPILLGRRVLKNRFLIDVAKQDVSFNGKRRNSK